ncbi:hypothetical protein TNIN_111101 [Trichonephila inaurata madagascariensis]|uniref:Uncharacterized protein n=1 Tax=Trichonephila inaurata madagascariensis TaxID=2747483 RepID=A0A8X7CP39_9ARAC|nr:hypothetical protein TNIN_111101 [Trichonephila inaurata madagascariensis]
MKSRRQTQLKLPLGRSFAQAIIGKNSQQRAARGNESSTSNSDNNSKNNGLNLEALNATNSQDGDFSFLQAIFEMKKIFDLFPNLISEMKKSSKCTDPTDKLHCLLKGTTGPTQSCGGVRDLIKIYISHFHVSTPPLLTGVEATLVALTPSDQEPFLVASLRPTNPTYKKPGADLDAY